MTILNNKSSTTHRRKKTIKGSEQNQRLSFATWVLLIMSFALLAYALYIIQTRVIETDTDVDTNLGNAQILQPVMQQDIAQ